MDKSEEQDLIRSIKNNPETFGVIFDMYYDTIFAYVLKRVGSVHISQDIVSDTFFKALDKLWQFRWLNISISGWLYRIATNEMNQYFRKKKHVPRSLDVLVEEQGFEPQDKIDILEEILEQERELASAKRWQEIRMKVAQLPEKYQEVLALRYFENKKIKEIAEILGKKEGTIKSLLSRAISKLQKQCNQKAESALYIIERRKGRLSEDEPIINKAKSS